METITIGEREFELGRPKTKHYRNLLMLMVGLLRENTDIATRITTMKEEEFDNALAENLAYFDVFLDVLETLSEQRLLELGAILLQFDDVQEGAKWIEGQGGLDPIWAFEAFAINCELADLGRIRDSFRRALRAIQSWREAGAE